ncbi:MAG: cobalt/nickel ABC transporter permease [Candidatus Bathyarchaeota archaeon B23]|nr:MAG: cobalt/nickel ABC transporter permease [Candidatus Bathyarchaeota archaeon B23]
MGVVRRVLLDKRVLTGDSIIHRLDPRPKFFFFLWISVLAYVFYDYVLTALFLLVILALAAAAGILRRILLVLAVIVLPGFAFAIPILSVLFPWNETLMFKLHILGFELPLYYEGFTWGLSWPLKIAVCVSSALLFYLTTEPGELIALLFKLRLPYKFIYMVTITLQLIPLLLDEIQTIYQAQLSRGLRTKANPVKRIWNFLALVIPLTLSSLMKVQTRAIALESRGFSAPVRKTCLYDIRLRAGDHLFFSAMIAVTLLLAYLYLLYGFSPIVHLKFYYVAG